MSTALMRYRIAAYIVGVWLLLLLFVAMPLKYLADDPTMVQVVGPVHGFLYMGYVVLAFDLARRARWSVERTILLMIMGTIPFLSFVAERRATRELGAATGA